MGFLPSLPRPDGQKKAYVRLTQDYDALDVANKVRTCTAAPQQRDARVNVGFRVSHTGSFCYCLQSADWHHLNKGPVEKNERLTDT